MNEKGSHVGNIAPESRLFKIRNTFWNRASVAFLLAWTCWRNMNCFKNSIWNITVQLTSTEAESKSQKSSESCCDVTSTSGVSDSFNDVILLLSCFAQVEEGFVNCGEIRNDLIGLRVQRALVLCPIWSKLKKELWGQLENYIAAQVILYLDF